MSASSSTTSQWLSQSVERLEKAGIGTARLDCLVLLEDALQKNRTHLLAYPDIKLTNEQVKLLNSWLDRRESHEPLAYIRNVTEFYGRKFYVDYRVLEPRPESETMINLLLKMETLHKTSDLRNWHILDVGCGSGALGITAALEIHGSTLDLIDIDSKCLKVAKSNLQKHKVTAELIHGDLLASVKRQPDIILANLPYVPDDFTVNKAALKEPQIAIFGGSDGLALYRRLFAQATGLKVILLTESLPFQHKTLSEIANKNGFNQIAEDDFIQVFKPY